MKQISVTIGKDTRTFVLVKTNAPKAYDYGGTIELYDGSYADVVERYLLVDAERWTYQQGRNQSGMYTFDMDDDVFDETLAAQALSKRIYGENV